MSILILTNIILLLVVGAELYGRATIGPNLGRGLGLSEFREIAMAGIALSSVAGVIALTATVLYWLGGIYFIPVLKQQPEHGRRMQLSLIAVPIAAFSLTAMVLLFYVS